MIQSPLPERVGPIRCGSAERRLLLSVVGVVVVAGVFMVLHHYDVALMRMRYLLIEDKPGGFLKHMLNSFREFGQTLSVIVAIAVVLAYPPGRVDRKRLIIGLLLAELIASMVYNPLKLTVVRYRPKHAITQLAPELAEEDRAKALTTFSTADTWGGWHPGNTDAENQSFPSGHSAAAFVLAATLAWSYPRLAGLFWILGIGCAASRFIDAVHWPSDCWIGAVSGYCCAWLMLRATGTLRARSSDPAFAR